MSRLTLSEINGRNETGTRRPNSSGYDESSQWKKVSRKGWTGGDRQLAPQMKPGSVSYETKVVGKKWFAFIPRTKESITSIDSIMNFD